jgi:hypothetical protein
MSATTQSPPKRTYNVRTKTDTLVRKALKIAQSNRQDEEGNEEKLMDIACEWLEEKARTIIEGGSK